MKSLNLLRKKDGMALLTVMIIFLVMVIILGGMIAMTNSNLNQSVVTKNHTAAFYSSEAGLIKYSTDFETELENLVNQTPYLSTSQFFAAVNTYVTNHGTKRVDLTPNNGEASYSDITLVDTGLDAGYNTYLLTSKGYVGDVQRVLEKVYRFKYTEGTVGNGFTIDKAVIAQNDILINGGQISGAPITTYSTTPGSIEFTSGGKVDSIEMLNSSNYNSLITKPNWASWSSYFNSGTVKVDELDKVNIFPTISIPTFPNKNSLSKLPNYTTPNGFKVIENGNLKTYSSGQFYNTTYVLPNAEQAYYVPEFIVSNNYGFTIDVGNTDRLLIVDKLLLNSNLWIKGQGTLTIYVTSNSGNITNNLNNKISFNFNNNTAGFIGNITNPEKFKVFVDDLFIKSGGNNVPGTVNFGGYAPFYMSILAKNLNFELGGSAGYQGYLVTGGEKVNITGGSSARVALYYAPNADFTLSSTLNGAVIADNFTANWGGNLTYSDVFFENFPFDVLDPITGGADGGAPSIDLKIGNTIEQ